LNEAGLRYGKRVACYELYRGDPTVDAARRAVRCGLCLPVRAVRY